VRMALGANAGSVRAMVLRQVGVMTIVGCVIGIAGALAIGRGAKSLLYEMQGFDPAVFGIAVVVLAAMVLPTWLGYKETLEKSVVTVKVFKPDTTKSGNPTLYKTDMQSLLSSLVGAPVKQANLPHAVQLQKQIENHGKKPKKGKGFTYASR